MNAQTNQKVQKQALALKHNQVVSSEHLEIKEIR